MTNEYRERLNDRLTVTHLRGATATTTDALLLAAFLPTVAGEALELGGGSGVVSLLAADRDRFSRADICERCAPLAELCRRNVLENGLAERLAVIEGDLRELSLPRRYASVFANPPYRRAKEGRPAADPLADAARFERAGTVQDFCLAAVRHLREDGSLSLVFPICRQADVLSALQGAGLYPCELVTVYPYPGGRPKLLLLRALCHPTALLHRRITLCEEQGGAPTAAAEALYRDGVLITEGDPT